MPQIILYSLLLIIQGMQASPKLQNPKSYITLLLQCTYEKEHTLSAALGATSVAMSWA